MAVLLLWATKPMLPRALEMTGAWGFTYKTIGFTWAKTTAAGDRFPIGMGFWTRANPELCLLATRGTPKRKRPRSLNSSSLPAEREHSRKPDEAYERIERCSTAPTWRCSPSTDILAGTPGATRFRRSRAHDPLTRGDPPAVQRQLSCPVGDDCSGRLGGFTGDGRHSRRGLCDRRF